jgi:hypothetical protein
MPVWTATAAAGMTRSISLGQVGEGDQQPIAVPLFLAALARQPDRAVLGLRLGLGLGLGLGLV